MNAHFPLAATASVIGDPARAAILVALLDGRALAAGELARAARVSAQSASMHLAQLLQSGFVDVAAQGRHRYYRLASPEVAHAIEALGAISTPRKRRPIGESAAIRYARTCYDHLAGELAVKITDLLQRNEFIVPRSERAFEVTGEGEAFFRQWGIEAALLRKKRKEVARRCLDWTERRYHLAGAIGAAMCKKMIEFRWMTRDDGSRIVHVTAEGRRHLDALFQSLRRE